MDPDYGVLDVHIDGQKVTLEQCNSEASGFYNFNPRYQEELTT
jgi:hypothetical protein